MKQKGRSVAAWVAARGTALFSQPRRVLRKPAARGQGYSVSGDSIKSIKQLEGEARLAGLKRAQRSPVDARGQQRRASLVGAGRKWRITNLRKAALVMATWR